MEKSMEVINLYNISKKYDGRERRALKDITLSFGTGKSYAITGPSGCGKSTLLNIIGLILEPTSGELFINRRRITETTGKECAGIRNQTFGYIAQNYLLIPGQNGYKNIEIPLRYSNKHYRKKEIMEKVNASAMTVGIEHVLYHICGSLSGGEKQRIAIARAIVNDPMIILADEPTGALDSRNSELVFSLLLDLVRQGKTLIMATHNMELAQRCDVQIKLLDGMVCNKM